MTHSVDEAARLGDRVVLLSARPARVLEVIQTGLPRPRPEHIGADPRFVELKEYLWDRVKALGLERDAARRSALFSGPTSDD